MSTGLIDHAMDYIADHIVKGVYIGNTINLSLSMASTGRKSADVQIPADPTGYERIGVAVYSNTYRCLVLGQAGSTLWYEITAATSGNATVRVTPLYKKV